LDVERKKTYNDRWIFYVIVLLVFYDEKGVNKWMLLLLIYQIYIIIIDEPYEQKLQKKLNVNCQPLQEK
jgi:hypothetical protein